MNETIPLDLINSVYLASVYSLGTAALSAKEAKKAKHNRFTKAAKAAGKLMKQGFVVFCPISHTHPVEFYADIELPNTHEFWLHQDFFWLSKCDALFVLDMPGWKESIGVGREIDFATKHSIPVYLYDMEKHSWQQIY